MSSIRFQNRLQNIGESGRYSENAIRQFEKIASMHKGLLPQIFILEDIGMHTISGILRELGYDSFDVYAPSGAKSSIRKVVLPSKSVTKKPAG